MITGAKAAHDFMLNSGALNYFAMSDFANISKGTVDVFGSSVSNAWNQSEDKNRMAGEAIGEVYGSMWMAGANADLMLHTASVYGFGKTLVNGRLDGNTVHEAKAIMGKSGKTGSVFSVLEEGGYQKIGNISHGKFSLAAQAGEVIAEESKIGKLLGSGKSVGGYLRTTSHYSTDFVKSQSFKRGLLPFAVGMAMTWGAKSILGFAGGVIDEAVRDHHRERSVHYDNRFFNTQRDEMSNMQALGSAMNNYESRYTSTARIYHSR